MWRGYGGNGKGVAVVFDASKLNRLDESPLVLAKVSYATTEQRKAWITSKISEAAQFIKSKIEDIQLHNIAYMYFERIKYFSLFSKHKVFSEEKEWRVVYMRDRDNTNALGGMLGYHIGNQGVEPKLNLKIKYIEGVTGLDLSLEKITERIILGPSISSPLAVEAMKKMLDKISKPALRDMLKASQIPFRSFNS